MKRIWPGIYLALFVAAFLGGLGVFGKDYSHTNVDWVCVSVAFFGFFIFPYLAISYARSRTERPLPRASFSRGFLGGWWTDPLQCLRVSILLLSGSVFGSLFTLPHADHQSFMVIWCMVAILFGSVIGELVALKKFRGSIT